ncbi:hypothetical protein RHMOL_Rhmol07G0098100 [Rhododendron molle]|uniref:Uncharacterized protein n=1 Tax=Rhododendron molle TaxID=49168 RepID=A0ACC0MYU5_RHOML|nr:hypothetical protein RHMOL_Rhmol07G0098100 [Rhododendron molle]
MFRPCENTSKRAYKYTHCNPLWPLGHSHSSIVMEATAAKPPLHTLTFSRATVVNRVFAAVYTCAVLALLYQHALTVLNSTTFLSFSLSLTFLFADLLLGFMWATGQCFRMRLVHRHVFPENLLKVTREEDFPAMDVFICTADPDKEPPMSVVNTALSVMAYDYPAEKLSVYVSDDGGSALTLFAFVEAAKFGSHWLPFCRRNKVMERCPQAYFRSKYPRSNETNQIKVMYESMKERVENVVDSGKVTDDCITNEQERQAFNKWTPGFTRQEHPTVVQLRVSAVLTNAPIILTLDCDMYSNDPQTPYSMLCYLFDTTINPELGYVQFPQRFHGLNKGDIYASELRREFLINSAGLNGLAGPNHVGTGCFFSRRVFFGGPSSFVSPEIPELRPDHVVKKPIQAQSILAMAHHVADCKYEDQTNWGSKLGFRYGTLVEDFYTGYRLQCEGWRSVFCNPNRPAFLGDAPITLNDALNQIKRWSVGLLEVAFSKYSPVTFGVRAMGPIMGHCYTHYAFWPIPSIPLTIYAFLPQLALLNGVSIFPKTRNPASPRRHSSSSIKMEAPDAVATTKPLLHTLTFSRAMVANRVFAAIYTCAVLALLYHHALTALSSTTFLSFSLSLAFLFSDFVFGFMWSTTQSFLMRPAHRRVFPENLRKVMREEDIPAMDVFICTADPHKEPPVSVVNTALSVMAYDYPAEKLSVYVSDDGGSDLTLFALVEAAKFGSHWLPFCRRNKVVERCPEAYFESNYPQSNESKQMKVMYKSMKKRVENVVDSGKVIDDYIINEQERQAFNKWTQGFTRHDHPTIIQVLSDVGKDKDITGESMPNLIYVSRQKSRNSPHHFKGGALNALLRVSAVMTNAPIILTLDCDMYSNDPQTLHRVLCYFSDSTIRSKVGYIQFPQRFHGLNKNDIYACEFKRLFLIHPMGMDGLAGPNHVGTGCFFSRRVFFGGPSSFVSPELPELRPDHVVKEPIQAQSILAMAHRVADCKYEDQSNWGSKVGFRYGSLVEDYYTGYQLQCEGWQSVFCHPNRPAFLGDVPITLNDVLNQNKRWSVGLLQVAFSKYSPVTFGVQAMGPMMGLCYAHSAFWPIWSIPLTIYAFLPQLALLNGVSIFPKVSDTWFLLYAFLFVGAYAQDCLVFILCEGTFLRWWSDQRMWMLRGVTSYLFGLIEFLTKCLGIATHGFILTSKVLDGEQSKRYDQGTFEFGVESPMFVPLSTAAIVNLIAFFRGLVGVFRGGDFDGLFVQIFVAGFVVVNCWPIYEAMVLRTDKGRMPTKTTLISTFLAWALYTAASHTPHT